MLPIYHSNLRPDMFLAIAQEYAHVSGEWSVLARRNKLRRKGGVSAWRNRFIA